MNRRRWKKPKIDDVAKYFNKRYTFKSGSDWTLPADVYVAEKWSLESLQIKKSELNSVKEQLGAYDLAQWSRHTKARDPSTAVLRKLRWAYSLEFQTQAWCKFYEIVNNFPIVTNAIDDKLISLHLCEAPGAFVSSLNHYLARNRPDVEWKWTANALNPYYEGNCEDEMITDDRFLKMTYDRWHFGSDFTGDIMSFDNHEELVKTMHDVRLVTADGSVDCMSDPGNQENHVAHLHYCETMTALRVLRRGGSFVLKIFTMFEESTLCLLYLLNCLFVDVHVYKPLTSKSGNSELYVVCLVYKGAEQIANWHDYLLPYRMNSTNVVNKSMFPLESLPKDYLTQIDQCSAYFMQLQISRIEENIESFGKNQNGPNSLKKFNNSIVEYFVRKYDMSDIPQERRITKSIIVQDNNGAKRRNNQFYIAYQSDEVNADLDLRIGKKFQTIRYSKYCTNDRLKNFHFKRTNDEFYRLVLARLPLNFRVVNLTRFDHADISRYNYAIVCELKACLESQKDPIVIGPIVTNILSNLLYLLANYFTHCIFVSAGCILFKDVHNPSKLLRQFDRISEEYAKCFAKQDVDLLQIVKHGHVVNSNLFDFIVKHNEDFAQYSHLT